MPHRKDYLLDQLRDFFEALARIATRLRDGELEKAEQEIEVLSSEAAIGELLQAGDGSAVPDHTYAAWKFQTQLLLLKIQLLEAQGQDTTIHRERAAAALRRLVALRPDVYDIELQEQLKQFE